MLSLLLGVIVSRMTPAVPATNRIRTDDVSFRTSVGFNLGAVGVVMILVVLYTVFW